MEVVNVEFFGKDPKVQKAIGVAHNVAVTKAPVLITGEVGVGKRTLATLIHQESSRAAGPIEVVDCSLEAQTVENQILGFRDQEGKFNKGALEKANKGCLLYTSPSPRD